MNKEENFNLIIAENKERIQRICRYYNSNVEDQKDMYQEVLIHIWKSLDRFRGDASMSTWIYRIAINTSLTYVGKAYKEMKLMVHAEMEHLGAVVAEEVMEGVQREEKNLENLQQELNLLSVIDKSIISLQLEGLTIQEIAAIIGITPANVKVKIHRIKLLLKQKLTKNIYENS